MKRKTITPQEIRERDKAIKNINEMYVTTLDEDGESSVQMRLEFLLENWIIEKSDYREYKRQLKLGISKNIYL